ncbi:MAG TPA: hypothetical protein VJR90_01105, partial [Gammaproteobacteria bacterium]|nr:hypothetical protein [Gammaproteobacteria bacterium]
MRRKDHCFAAGGALREPPPEHVKKELSFMQKKGAPPSMIKAEKKEHGLPFGKKARRFDEGGHVNIDDDTRARARAAIMARLARQDAEGAGDA